MSDETSSPDAERSRRGGLKLTVLLADCGTQAPPPYGTLNLLNAGWSVTGADPSGLVPPQAVAVFYEVPWDRCNRNLELQIRLLDEDEQVVVLPENRSLDLVQTIRVSPPQGSPNGSPGVGNALIQLSTPFPLQSGRRYAWTATLDGVSDPAWRASFYVADSPSPLRLREP